jgi:hypothetical protein
VHYAYTIMQSWADYYGDNGGHTFASVVLKPSAVPALTSAKLPSKGLASMKFFPSRRPRLRVGGRGTREQAQREVLSGRGETLGGDWDAEEGKKGPARKKVKTA